MIVKWNSCYITTEVSPQPFAGCMPFAWIVGIMTRTHHIVSHTSTTLLLKNQIHLWALISFSVFGHLRCACTHWQCCPLLQQSKARHPCWDPSILPSVDFNLSPCHPIPKHMKSKKLSDCTFYFYLSEWYIWLYRQGESIILRLYIK